MDKRKVTETILDFNGTSLDQILTSFAERGLLEQAGVPRLVLDPVLRRALELAEEYRAARKMLDGLSCY